jgi:hypothetical protein
MALSLITICGVNCTSFYVGFEVFTAVVVKSIFFLRNVGCNSTDYTASYPRR